MKYNKKFMLEAIRVANENIQNQGGPFGAVIVKDGEIIAASGNSVTTDNDPTAHAEVNTIRKACKVSKWTPLVRGQPMCPQIDTCHMLMS